MKKAKLLSLFILLVSFSACSKEHFFGEYSLNPEQFMQEMEFSSVRLRSSSIGKKQVCYYDYDFSIKGLLKEIRSYTKVDKIDAKSERFAVYEDRWYVILDSIPSMSQKSMTIYENGYLEIANILSKEIYYSFYSIDKDYAKIIVDKIDSTISYFEKCEEECIAECNKHCTMDNFLNALSNLTDGDLSCWYEDHYYTYQDDNRFLVQPISAITSYFLKEENNSFVETMCYGSRDAEQDWFFRLSRDFNEVELMYWGRDEFLRSFEAKKYYSIDVEDGRNLYNYAAEIATTKGDKIYTGY